MRLRAGRINNSERLYLSLSNGSRKSFNKSKAFSKRCITGASLEFTTNTEKDKNSNRT